MNHLNQFFNEYGTSIGWLMVVVGIASNNTNVILVGAIFIFSKGK